MKTEAITTEESQILLNLYKEYDGQTTKILSDPRVKKMNKESNHIINHIAYVYKNKEYGKKTKKRPRNNQEDNSPEDSYSVIRNIIITETERHNSLI